MFLGLSATSLQYFLSQQISHQQPASSTFLSEQTSHQPNEHAAWSVGACRPDTQNHVLC
jgi:hypothetical protein